MPFYKVEGTITISAYTYVEAATPEQAKRIASNREGRLCPNGPEREGYSPFDYAIAEEGDGELEPYSIVETDHRPDEWE